MFKKKLIHQFIYLESKERKAGDRWETAMFLERRLGETKDHSSNGPLCKGVFNSSTGIAVR